ncbi:MAG: chorismate-binding protein, partial [Planctomycetota bacterium]
MSHRPTLEEFRGLGVHNRRVPISRTLVSDTLTPVSAYCRLRRSGPSFLFESVVGGEKIGRYSVLGSDPFLTVSARGKELTVDDGGGKPEVRLVDDPLAELQTYLDEYTAEALPGLPKFTGGAVGYAGYDTVRYVEHLPDAPNDDRQLPDLHFSFYDRMVVFDQLHKTVIVIAHARPDTDDFEFEYLSACRAIDAICRDLQTGHDDLQLTDVDRSGNPSLDFESNFTRMGFEQAVEQGQEYIRAGDVFQVVLSQRLRRETHARPLDIYRALRVVNPSPFMFLLTIPGAQLIGCSPEIMVRVADKTVTIRPLAGTRPRGKDDE